MGSLPVMTAGIAPWAEPYISGETTEREFQVARAMVNLSLYTAVLNTPVNIFDPLGLKPMDMFPDADAAARDAACYLKNNPLIIGGEHWEKASAIFKHKLDGQYYYNVPYHRKDLPPGQSSPNYDLKLGDKDTVEGDIHDHIKAGRFSDKNEFLRERTH